jgi:hypothetical protein
MLTILLIYLVGRAFYNLAFDYNKSKWGFAILGNVVYFGSTFIFGMILGVILLATDHLDFLNTTPKILLNLMGLPIGLLSCWIFYRILLSNWEKQQVIKTDDSLDGNLV